MIGELFVHPHVLSFNTILWLVVPLCVSVAVVYKAIRVNSLRELPRQAATLVILMLAGLFALGAGLWAIHEYWP